MALNPVQAAHATLLQRPFSSPIHQAGSIYDGEQGAYTKFHQAYQGGTGAGQAAYVFALHPNTNYAYSAAVTGGASTITPGLTFTSTASPGQATLLASAQKMRGIAAAIRLAMPSLSLTNMVGEFAVGVISADTFVATTTIDQLFTFAQGKGNVTRDLHEVRWYPGSFDSKYSSVTNSTLASTGSDLNDTNVVYVALRGIPASTAVLTESITITEWTPRPGSGMAVSSQTSSGSDHQHTIQTLHNAAPGWHHTAKNTAERLLEDGIHGAGKFAGAMGRKIGSAALSKFESYVGSLAAFGL